MNKKMLILIICISLVLAIVIGIIASSLFLGDRKVTATSVKITNEIFNNPTRTHVADITNGAQSVQLSWDILPANTEDKAVTFISDNTKFAVTAGGLVTFSQAWEGASITIKTNDGGFTDTVNIITTTDTAQTIAYDFANNKVSLSEGSNYILDDDETLVLYLGVNYFFGDFEIAANSFFDKVDNTNVINPKTAGLTSLSIKSGTKTNTLAVKVIKQISAISLPTELNVLTSKFITVGSKNKYNFNFVAHSSSGEVLPSELEVVYSVRLKNGSAYESVQVAKLENGVHTVAGVVSITDGNKVQFSDSAIGKTYKLTVASKFAPTKTASFDFAINDAHNANSHVEFLGLFNDDTIEKINVVNNIIVSQEGFTVNADGSTYLDIRISNGGIYNRSSAIALEGNNFKIDASNLPLFQPKYEPNGDPHFRHSVPGLFGLGKPSVGDHKDYIKKYYEPSLMEKLSVSSPTLSDTEKATQKAYVLGFYANAPKFIFNNVNIIGHSGYGLNGRLGTDGKIIKNADGSIPTHEKNQYLGFDTMNGLNVTGIDLSLTNCSISRFNAGIRTDDSSFGIKFDNCKMGDMAGYQAYIRRTTNITIKDSFFGQGGHTAVYLKAENTGTLIDSFTPIEGSGIYENNPNAKGVVCNLIGDVKFDNWIDGKDGYFKLSSSRTLPGLVKTLIKQTLGNNAFGYILRFDGDESLTEAQKLDAAKFNFGILCDSLESDEASNKTDINVGGLKNFVTNEKYDKDAYYKALLYGFAAQDPANSANKDNLLKMAAAQLQKININPNLTMASINASKIGNYMDAMSYFVLGRVDAPTGN